MSNSNYIPNPIDTSDVVLSDELLDFRETIAKNVHETWAAGRIKDGWTYGDELDEELKKHPCLIPYDELPECEKEYDRNTAMETLKLILKLGWKIEKQ